MENLKEVLNTVITKAVNSFNHNSINQIISGFTIDETSKNDFLFQLSIFSSEMESCYSYDHEGVEDEPFLYDVDANVSFIVNFDGKEIYYDNGTFELDSYEESNIIYNGEINSDTFSLGTDDKSFIQKEMITLIDNLVDFIKEV